MKLISLVFTIACVLMIVSTGIGASDNDENIALNDAQSAIERMYAYTGIDEMRGFDKNSVTAVRPDTLTDDQTPFLSGWVNGRPLWKIHIEGLLLYYKKFDEKDSISKDMDIYLDSKTGVLIRIDIYSAQKNSLTLRAPTAKEAENQMRSEKYYSFPKTLPKAKLLDFADLAMRYSAFTSAQFVIYRCGKAEPKPTWIVDYIFPAGALPDVLKDTHTRQFKSAATGEVMSATTIPTYKRLE